MIITQKKSTILAIIGLLITLARVEGTGTGTVLLRVGEVLDEESPLCFVEAEVCLEQKKNGNFVLIKEDDSVLWESGYRGAKGSGYNTKLSNKGILITRHGDNPDSVWKTVRNGDKNSEYLLILSGNQKKLSIELNNEIVWEVDTKKDEETESPLQDNMVSPYYQWESSMWPERFLKGKSILDIDTFDKALHEVSKNFCDLGITATLFNDKSEQVYQKTIGTKYNTEGTPGVDTPLIDGWTGDTTFALYSNSKVIPAIIFLASVVDTGKGYLDEPIYNTFPDLIDENDAVGKVTPRMILSHTSGLQGFDRLDPVNDPYYSCKYGSSPLIDCLEIIFAAGLASDEDFGVFEPGHLRFYNNEAFDILAELIKRKTGYDNLDDVFEKYITGPLGMEDTTYDCPLVKSTPDKPHVAWGVCSTGHDMPKLIQVLSNNGKTLEGKQILSSYSIKEIFSQQVRTAANFDLTAWVHFSTSACVSKTSIGLASIGRPNHDMVGYGLGTKVMSGVKGQYLGHGASVGGLWIVAPGRFSVYVAFMKNIPPYDWLVDVLDKFEHASTFMVSNAIPVDGADEENYIEITPCVDGMFHYQREFFDSLTTDGVC